MRRHLQYELAAIQYESGDFAAAVATFREAAIPMYPDPQFQNYVATLFRAGMYSDALQIAAAARLENGPIGGVSLIEAHILQVIGDFQAAEAILQSLTDQEPPDLEVRLALIRVLIREGKNEAAKSHVNDIAMEDIQSDASLLLDVAEARQILEMPDSLEWAFRGRQLGIDVPEVHKRYVYIFLNRERVDEPLLDVTTVDAGCTVKLQREDEEVILTILEGEATRSRNEVLATDEVAKQLIGRRVGDVVKFGQNPAAILEYRVAIIQSKYVHAFQESLQNFPIWFPNDQDLIRIETRQNDLSSLSLLLDERHKAAEEVMSVYRAKPITVGVVAELLGVSVIDVWISLVGLRDERLFASIGDANESARDEERLESLPALVLDVTGILTFAHLDLLDELADAFRVVAPSSVAMDLRRHYANRFKGAVPTGSLGKVGDDYYSNELSESEIEAGRQYMQRILDFVSQRVETIPVAAALDLAPGEYEELQATLGGPSADAMIAAISPDHVLYSDDLRLRQLAQSRGIDGTWAQALLKRLLKAEKITRDQYLRSVERLLLSNYRHPTVSAEDLFDLMEAGGFEVTTAIEELLRASLGPEYGDSVFDVSANLITSLWRTQLSELRVEALTTAVLQAVLLQRPSPREGLNKLVVMLNQRFQLDPLGLRRLRSLLRDGQ